MHAAFHPDRCSTHVRFFLSGADAIGLIFVGKQLPARRLRLGKLNNSNQVLFSRKQ